MAGILDSLLGTLRDAVRNSTSSLGPCNACDEPALPVACVICGEHTCLQHAWISGEAFTQRAIPRVICSCCAEDIRRRDQAARRRAAKQNPHQRQKRWQQQARPANVVKERKEWARKVLGVTAQATKKEIAAAYKEKARKYHPDHNPGDAVAEAAFKHVAEAYRVLMDKA